MVKIQSWGCLTSDTHNIVALHNRLDVQKQLYELKATNNKLLAYGMGRSYGDACLNSNANLLLTQGLNHLIFFDETTGVLECESGVLLKDIQELMIPRGWMLAVSPGTQMVTIGGAIANDIHGKNHHVYGSFGDMLLGITLLRTNGEIIECSPQHNLLWFEATIGGIGLTGIIVKAQIQLRKITGPWLKTESIAYHSLSEFFNLCDESEAHWEHTVSWIDCLSVDYKKDSKHARGIFIRGNHVSVLNRIDPIYKKKVMPITPSISLVNNVTLRLFNNTYFLLNKYKQGTEIKHYQPFFYPLDNIHHWNRMYGPKGFYQYQCVIPRPVGQAFIQSILEQISKLGTGSFLAVLKTFGTKHSRGMLGFPQPGVTLALDFPNLGGITHQLLNNLDAIVKEAGGRIYLAKDTRMSSELFEAGYPRLKEFLTFRDEGISSNMSRRLMGF